MGDSTAQGIGAADQLQGYVGQLLERLGPGWRVLNLSRTGDRLSHVVDKQIATLAGLAVEPRLVTCAAGANDLLRTSLDRLLADLDRLMAGLPTGAVIATLPQGLRPKKAEAANHLIRTSAPHRGLRVADVWTRTGPPWKGRFASDGFHPNEVGYRSWTDAFAAALGLPQAK